MILIWLKFAIFLVVLLVSFDYAGQLLPSLFTNDRQILISGIFAGQYYQWLLSKK